MNLTTKNDIQVCKNMTRAYGTSYFISTYFFPKTLREKTWVLYAFVRYPDEIVDNQEKDALTAREKVLEWKKEWQKAYSGSTEVHPVLRANAVLWKECNIPFEYSDIFLDAMLQDTNKSRYSNYQELVDYMYGSATIVGYMMSYIIGFKDGALPFARALGEAFQLTNFLRDIKEDLSRGRIYIPKEDMDAYKVTDKDFSDEEMSPRMKELINFEIKRNKALYDTAKKGIDLLDRKGQRAVRIALYLYKEILNKINKNPEIIFKKRVRVSKLRKLIIIIKNL